MGSETLNFNFTYDSDSDKLGCLDINGDFVPFSSDGGGIDTSDATAYAKNIENGYTAYCRGEKITGTAYIEHTISKYSGSIQTLSVNRSYIRATSVGNYALFAGGMYYSEHEVTVNNVDAYDDSLSRSNPTGLVYGKHSCGATTIGDHALFGGGGSGYGVRPEVEAYDTSLTRSLAPNIASRIYLAASTIGDYAIFAGGAYIGNGAISGVNYVEACNSSLTKVPVSQGLSNTAYNLTGGSNNNYAVFGGGMYSAALDAYNTSLTKSIPTNLSVGGHNKAATKTGDYILFVGGRTGSNIVDAYDGYLTKSTPENLPSSKTSPGATTLGLNYALIGGGGDTLMDAYDSTLTRSSLTSLSASKNLATTIKEDYALFNAGVYVEAYYMS